MIKDEFKKVKEKSSTITGSRYIIVLHADKDPLTFKSNVDFARYLGITGNIRKARVKPAYGGQQVAGKYIIHVPKQIYGDKNFARFNWKETPTREGNRVNRKPTKKYDDSDESD